MKTYLYMLFLLLSSSALVAQRKTLRDYPEDKFLTIPLYNVSFPGMEKWDYDRADYRFSNGDRLLVLYESRVDYTTAIISDGRMSDTSITNYTCCSFPAMNLELVKEEDISVIFTDDNAFVQYIYKGDTVRFEALSYDELYYVHPDDDANKIKPCKGKTKQMANESGDRYTWASSRRDAIYIQYIKSDTSTVDYYFRIDGEEFGSLLFTLGVFELEENGKLTGEKYTCTPVFEMNNKKWQLVDVCNLDYKKYVIFERMD